ncbi:MAG: MAPEG family protein [Rhodobacteraceae bacterium]|nr:MAPEG family protein [Paracoccaceae bacterium]
MIEIYPLTALTTLVSLLVYLWVTLKVGGARAKFGVKAPAVDGPPDFMRVFRVQQNTLEQIVMYLPALWLFAVAWGDVIAAGVGVFWPIGRLVYAMSYYQAAEKRGAGFGITFLSTAVLILGALAGVATRLA